MKRRPDIAFIEVGIRQRSDTQAIASRIRTARRRKRLTLESLAKIALLDKGYLSRIERGQKTPSISALLQIAEALGVRLGYLFGEATAPDAITIVRHDRHTRLPGRADPPGHVIEAILPANRTRRLSAFLAMPGPDSGTRQADHTGDELIYVLDGSVAVSFADRSVTLQVGDCIHFDGHLRHQVHRVGKRVAKVLIVVAQDLPGAAR